MEFIASSGPMQQAMAKLGKVAGLDTTVLLQGESGTGKEVAARFLHDRHPSRRQHELVCVHCGAIPDTLLESELFGHVKGAFTGAERERVGRFEQANGGTLLLDEISTMRPDAQVRLLRVLQERRVTRLGATESVPVDVRVVVATNTPLDRMIADGAFRRDLYYRISAYPVALPALRERPSEIPELTELFVRRTSERLGLPGGKRLAAAALRALGAYDWPGNVRELENVIEYACIQAQARPVVDLSDMPPHIAGLQSDGGVLSRNVVLTEDGLSFRAAVTSLERELILQSLRLAEGNKARAAELLELKRTTFLEKLRRLELDGLLTAS